MRRKVLSIAFLLAFETLAITLMPAQLYISSPSAAPKPRARVAFSHALPKLNGDQLKATIVEVHYGPGESSPQHSHPCAVIGYVLEGTLRTQVKGQSEAIYKVGESFYEAPNVIHAVSANASATDPATFLAYFVCDRETMLSVDVPQSPNQSQGGK
jgi:quercetin dioxygenase-like cupin family protein